MDAGGNQRGGYPITKTAAESWTYRSYDADGTTKVGDPWCKQCIERCTECNEAAPDKCNKGKCFKLLAADSTFFQDGKTMKCWNKKTDCDPGKY